MEPASFTAELRMSLFVSERSPRTATVMTRPSSTTTIMISMRVKPLAAARVRRPAMVRSAVRLLPGLDVVGGALLLVGTARDHVGAVGVVLAGALDDEVLAPGILQHLLEVLLRHQILHPLRTLA